MTEQEAPRQRDSHIFQREQHDHYAEPHWCSARLFDVEEFEGSIWDPCCGWGRIPEAAERCGYHMVGSDVVDRAEHRGRSVPFLEADFLNWPTGMDPPAAGNIVTNPPFNLLREITERALQVSTRKVAILCPLRRLPAARWLEALPLARVWLMTPRPSMPSGAHIRAGGKVGGGTQDYCWLVFDHSIERAVAQRLPELRWLHRDPQEAGK
jgi:hypothetical protein